MYKPASGPGTFAGTPTQSLSLVTKDALHLWVMTCQERYARNCGFRTVKAKDSSRVFYAPLVI